LTQSVLYKALAYINECDLIWLISDVSYNLCKSVSNYPNTHILYIYITIEQKFGKEQMANVAGVGLVSS